MTRDVPSSDWARFLEAFSLQHDRWLVNVESIHGSKCDLEAHNAPLDGIEARLGHEPREIVITVGDPTDAVQHVIVRNPRHLRVEVENGVEQAIVIEEPDGGVTRVAFRTPVAPELVDGIAP